MEKALKDAITICKTLLRNGYDAHVINAPVQEHLLKHSKQLAVDIACEPDLETLLKLFPEARVEPDQRAIAQMEKTACFSVSMPWKWRMPAIPSFPCCASPPPWPA